jgi:hypothetical protein
MAENRVRSRAVGDFPTLTDAEGVAAAVLIGRRQRLEPNCLRRATSFRRDAADCGRL